MTPGRTGAAADDASGWIAFDGPLELLPAATRRVEASLDAVQVNLGVNKAGVALRPFMYVGTALQRRLGARAGDVVARR